MEGADQSTEPWWWQPLEFTQSSPYYMNLQRGIFDVAFWKGENEAVFYFINLNSVIFPQGKLYNNPSISVSLSLSLSHSLRQNSVKGNIVSCTHSGTPKVLKYLYNITSYLSKKELLMPRKCD